MPCNHGEIFWWNCSQCKRDKEIQDHNAMLDREREKRETEYQTLCELKRIRQLLEVERIIKENHNGY